MDVVLATTEFFPPANLNQAIKHSLGLEGISNKALLGTSMSTNSKNVPITARLLSKHEGANVELRAEMRGEAEGISVRLAVLPPSAAPVWAQG